jgi:hypothetical protein
MTREITNAISLSIRALISLVSQLLLPLQPRIGGLLHINNSWTTEPQPIPLDVVDGPTC